MGADGGVASLRVTVGDAVHEFGEDVVSIGRDPRQSLVLEHPDVSRRHAELRRSGGGWHVVDLGSTNGTWAAGRRLAGPERLPDGRPLTIQVGGGGGVEVVVEVVSSDWPRERAGGPEASDRPDFGRDDPVDVVPPGHLSHGLSVLPPDVLDGGTLTIGRDERNDVVIDDALVSRLHARIELGRPTVLTDLGSFNGTFVNGERLVAPKVLEPGDEVIFGNQAFTWTGADLAARSTRSSLTLFAENLTTTTRSRKRILDDVSFSLEPSTLTAVIGPSGAGKSTLLGALAGHHPATHGHVRWQGHDLYSNYELLRFQIGLVPQSDIQHPQLTVRRSLTYAAMLRLPPDTTTPERSKRVDQVVNQMQLDRQIDQRIGSQLSGGQRKRVSIATELITAPPLLLLDEPTSGLDPGLDRDIMHQLRFLADEGRVVLVVTHSVLALDVCDNVLILATGGRRAYFGPPSGVLSHFDCQDYPAVFDLLDDPGIVSRLPGGSQHADTGSLPAVNEELTPPPIQSRARQLVTLMRRNAALMVSDRLLLAMLVLMPLVLGGLSRVVAGSAGLSLDFTAHTNAAGAEVFSQREAVQRLTILVLAAALMGTAVTIRELVKERAVFQREYAVGLSPTVYLMSKIVVLGSACFVQGLIVTFLGTVGLPGPDGSGVLGLGSFEIALAVGALAFTMAVIGLAVSAIVTSSEQTMPALVGVVMLQLVLSSALVPVTGRAVLEQVAWIAPARWAYAASAVSSDLNRAPARTDSLYEHSAGQWFLNMGAMGLLLGMALAAGLYFVRRSATPRH